MDSVKPDAYKYDSLIAILYRLGTRRVETLMGFVHKHLLCSRIDLEIEPSLQTSESVLYHPNTIYLAMQDVLRPTEATRSREKGYG